MHKHSLEQWQHNHDFAIIHEKGESRTKLVLVITAVTMVAEIIAGSVFGSMALLTDGWHMRTHTGAFALLFLLIIIPENILITGILHLVQVR